MNMSIGTERDAQQHMYELVWRVKGEMKRTFSPQYHGTDDPIAKHLNIKVVEQKVLYGKGGMYVPAEYPRIAIDIQSGEQERLNFTFFHEICHHLIRQDEELYGFLDDHAANNLHGTIEHYCDIGAAEFLIPRDEIRELIDQQGFSIEMIRDFDAIFPASKPAIAIQMAQCAAHQCIITVCEYDLLPEGNNGQFALKGIPETTQPQLFVQYSSSSPSCKYRSGRFIPISKEHFLAGVYEAQNFARGHDNIPFRSGTKWAVNCEGFFYKGKVYAAFHITDPKSVQQMSFL